MWTCRAATPDVKCADCITVAIGEACHLDRLFLDRQSGDKLVPRW